MTAFNFEADCTCRASWRIGRVAYHVNGGVERLRSIAGLSGDSIRRLSKADFNRTPGIWRCLAAGETG